MFRRRDKIPFWGRVREFFAPRTGWRRALEYYSHRMKRLPDSPTRIALGFACGAYVSFTPFFGLHFIVAAALAWAIRANVFASAIGTFVGNPITFLFIPPLCIEIGSWVIDTPFTADSFKDLGFGDLAILFLSNLHELFLPYLIGGQLPGILCAVICFYIVRPLVAQYQSRRRAKMVARAKARIKKEASRTAPSES